MAEEALIAELRLGYQKFQQDLRDAQRTAESQSRDIANALGNIDKSIKDLPQSFNKLNSELRDSQQQMRAASQETGRFSSAMSTLKGTLASLGLLITAQQMIQFAGAAARAGESVLGLEAQLRVATGSAQGAAQAMAFAAGEASRLAQDTLTAQTTFTQIAAAARGTAIEGKGAEIIFRGMASAVTAAGKSGDDFQRILNQIVQGINKNKVQMEDLNVLAENGIPAQKELANAMRITGESLSDAMQKGRVSAEAFILLGQRLIDLNRQIAEEAANRLPGQFRRGLNEVKDEFRDLFAAIFESKDLVKALSPFLTATDIFPSREEMKKKVDELAQQFVLLSSIFMLLTDAMFKNFRKGWDELVGIVGKIDDWIKKQFDKIPMPQFIEDMGQAINAFLTGTEEGVEKVKKSLQEMSTVELLFNKEDKVGSLKEIERRLRESVNNINKSIGIETIDILNPEKTGDAAKESVNAIDSEYERLQKLRDKLLKDIYAPSKAELEKAAKEVLAEQEKNLRIQIDRWREWQEKADKEKLDAEEKYYKDRFKIIDKNTAIEQKKREDAAKADIEMARAVYQIKLDLEKAGGTLGLTDPNIAAPTSDAIKAAEELAERQEEIFENMGENIQRELGNILTDVFSGQIDSIQDIADNIVQIFARTAAEITTAMVIQPGIDSLVKRIQSAFEGHGFGGPLTGVERLGVGIGGGLLGAGIASGNALGDQTASGVAGGAISGASIGLALSPPGFQLLGAAIGGVIGALAGLTAALLGAEEKIELGIRTGSPDPRDTQFGYSARGPFGNISLTDRGSNTSRSDTITVAQIIAEADLLLASLMTQRMRDIVSIHLEGQPFELDAKEMDDAVAQAIQTRLFIALRALTDEATAINIVGDPYTGTAQNIDVIQKRAAEALAILKMIEEFQIADMGDVAMQIHRIQEEFNALIDRALSLGLDVQAAQLAARRDEEIAGITTDFNANIRDQILGFTDPAQQAAEELQRIQDEIWQNAVAAGADMAAVQELFVLQWEEHNARWAAGGQAGADAIAQLTERIQDFGSWNMSGTMQQLRALQDTFNELAAEAARLGFGMEGLTEAYRQQHNAIILAAQQNLQAATLAITDPFGAAMLAISIQVQAFQQLVNEGILDQASVDAYSQAAIEQAQWNEALRISSGAAGGAIGSFTSQLDDFIAAGSDVSSVQAQINAVMDQFMNLELALLHLASVGAITTDQLNSYMGGITASRDRQIAQIQAEESARQAEEARRLQEAAQREQERRREEARRAREQREAEAARRRQERESAVDSINAFIRSGMSAAMQQLQALKDRFEELREEARRLGISTRGLTASYKAQVQQIKQQAKDMLISAINGLTNSLAEAYANILRQASEFRRMQQEGLVSRRDVDRWQRLAIRDAKFAEANRLASGSGGTAESQYRDTIQAFVEAGKPVSDLGQQLDDLHESALGLMRGLVMLGMSTKAVQQSLTQQHLAIMAEAHRQVQSVINSMGLPFASAVAQAQEQIEDLRKLVADGLVPKTFVEYAVRLIEADTLVQEALRRISGAPINSIEQLADSFDQFIRAGNPLSSAGQQLYDLTENFLNLADAAHLLGFSTTELEESYLAQSQVIREQIIKDIENQLSAQIQAIESINDYLSSLRLAEEQPLNLRFDEAQRQFQEALGGDDISEMISAADALRDLARQQFGSGSGFWDVENQIITALGDIQAREQAAVDAERQRLTDQIDREIQGLQIGQSSLDQLQRVAHSNSEMARGIDEMIVLLRISQQREEQTYALLERIVATNRA